MLENGTDSDLFVVEAATGRLEVASGATLDYESIPSLEVVLQVSDGKDADHNTDYAVDDFITVTIDLTHVDEPGKVILSATQLQVGSPLTAVLTDPDGSVSDIDWLWERSPDPDGASGWKTINGASSDAYTPVAADVDMYLRATLNTPMPKVLARAPLERRWTRSRPYPRSIQAWIR